MGWHQRVVRGWVSANPHALTLQRTYPRVNLRQDHLVPSFNVQAETSESLRKLLGPIHESGDGGRPSENRHVASAGNKLDLVLIVESVFDLALTSHPGQVVIARIQAGELEKIPGRSLSVRAGELCPVDREVHGGLITAWHSTHLLLRDFARCLKSVTYVAVDATPAQNG